VGFSIQERRINKMAIFNFDLFVTVEADDFESALSWLKAMPLERHDFEIVDYSELEIE
jgi:hypothetical protein